MIPKHKTTLKVALISAIGLSVALFVHSKVSTTQANDNISEVVEKSSLMPPQVLTGNVNKTLEEFSFTADNGEVYHIADPSHLLDELAKDSGRTHSLYELKDVRIKARISQTGNYGHMGYYQYQLTVTDVLDSEV